MMKYTISHFSQGTKFPTCLQIAMSQRKNNSTWTTGIVGKLFFFGEEDWG